MMGAPAHLALCGAILGVQLLAEAVHLGARNRLVVSSQQEH